MKLCEFLVDGVVKSAKVGVYGNYNFQFPSNLNTAKLVIELEDPENKFGLLTCSHWLLKQEASVPWRQQNRNDMAPYGSCVRKSFTTNEHTITVKRNLLRKIGEVKDDSDVKWPSDIDLLGSIDGAPTLWNDVKSAKTHVPNPFPSGVKDLNGTLQTFENYDKILTEETLIGMLESLEMVCVQGKLYSKVVPTQVKVLAPATQQQFKEIGHHSALD